jgi:CheY-like chemotaxis protein
MSRHPGTDDPLKGIPILLVSDDTESRSMLRKILSARAALVRSQTTVGEGLASFRAHGAAVVVAQLRYPPGEALALIRGLRDLNPLVPAISVGSASDVAHREQCLRAGFHLHVTEPLEVGQLVELVVGLASPVGGEGSFEP